MTALRLARAFDEADGAVPPPRDGGGEVLGLQADAAARRRGAGVPRRQRLRRGVTAAAALPRGPLNSIWEGSGNVIALDVLRALAREPETAEAFLAEVRLAAGADARLDAAIVRLEKELAQPEEQSAGRLLESLAVSLQGSLLVRHGAPEVADAFCARLESPGAVFGTLPSSVDHAAIVARSTPDASTGRLRPWPSRSTTAPSEAATTAGPRVSRPS